MSKTAKKSHSKSQDPTSLGRTFKRSLKSGQVLLGGMAVEYLRPSLVKIYRYAGFDFIYIEKEHGLFEGSELTDFILSARDNQMPIISKVGELNRPEVARLLEAGVVGIQLPRTESRQDLLTLIDYVKFPPLGTRAGAPGYGNTDYLLPEDEKAWLKKANATTVVVAHIETALGYENAESIITTPHLDMVYVGPSDFSISMGYPGEWDHPTIKKALGRILDLCLKHKVPFGTTASGPKAASGWIAKGCQFFEVIDEVSLLSEGAKKTVAAYRLT